MFCHALNIFVLSCAGSLRAVGGALGKVENRSAPLGEGPGGAPGPGGGGGGRCHAPGCVLRSGGGYAELAAYGFPGAG